MELTEQEKAKAMLEYLEYFTFIRMNISCYARTADEFDLMLKSEISKRVKQCNDIINPPVEETKLKSNRKIKA